MAVITVATEEKFDEIIAKHPKVVVDFSATWCGPCKLVKPIFEKLSNEYTDILFINVDVDDVSAVAQKCEIRAMPTFQFFKDGKKVDDLTGANKVGLEQKVKDLAA